MPGQPNADGTFAHSIADPDVVFDGATSTWHLYYSANAAAGCADSGALIIKHATSTDGLAWTVQREPALGRSAQGAWDEINRETPTVVQVPSNPPQRRWLMYYAGARRQVGGFTFNNYELGLAFSADGNAFTRLPAAESPYGQEGLLMRVAAALPMVSNIADGVLADPDVVVRDGVFHLYFSSFACRGTCATNADTLVFGVSHASSTDGIHFTPTAQNPIALGQQPAVVFNTARCQYEMWVRADTDAERDSVPHTFNQAAGFRRWTSTDGLQWTMPAAQPHDFAFDATVPSERWGLLTGVDVVQHGGQQLMYYVAFGTVQNPEGCFVFAQPSVAEFCFGDPPNQVCVVASATGLNRAVRAQP